MASIPRGQPERQATLTPGERRLALVMGLPLIDGVFITLVLAGVLETVAGILITGAVVFMGGASVAVIVSDLTGRPVDHLPTVALVGAIIVPVAAVQAMLAPTLASVIDVAVLERFAAVILLAIAAGMASDRIGQYLPRHGVIVVLALVASVQPNSLAIQPAIAWDQAIAAVAAAGVAVVLAGTLVLVNSHVRSALDPRRFEVGGACSLAWLGIALITPLPENGAILILGMALVIALEWDRPRLPITTTLWELGRVIVPERRKDRY